MTRRRSVDLTLAALADPVRRRAIELLSREPRRAGDLADALGLAAPAMSRHLKALKDGGLVEEKFAAFDARVRIYALKDGAMSDLRKWLASTEDLWSEQLLAFRKHIEGRGE